MNGDARGWRMALLPDSLMNPARSQQAVSFDVLAALEECGYGVLQLPPAGEYGPLLAVIADQVAEYSHHGYAVAALNIRGEAADGLHWRRLAPLLRHRGVAPPPRHVIDPAHEHAQEQQRLIAFLKDFDLPAEERRRWRS